MRPRDQYVDGLKKQLDFWSTGVARWSSAWTELCKGADEAWERMREAAGAASGYFEKIPARKQPAPRKAKRKARVAK